MKWSLLFGISILAALLLYLDPTKVIEAAKTAEIEYFLIAIGINFLELLFQTLRFRSFSSRFKIKDRSFLTHAKIQAVANVSTYLAPAKTGHAIKIFLQKKIMNLEYPKGLSIFFIERFQEFLGVYILLLTIALFIGSKIGFLSRYYIPISFLLVIMIGITVAIIKLNIQPLVNRLTPEKFKGTFNFKSLQTAIKGNFNYWLFGKTLLYSLTTPILSIIRLFVVFLAFGMNPDLIILSGVFLISLLIGVVTFLPGGLGAFETSAVALYTTGLNYDPVQVGAALLTLRFFSIAFDSVMGLLAARSLEKQEKQITAKQMLQLHKADI